MAKLKTKYCCSACGSESPKWAGQCTDCNAWNSFVELVGAPLGAKNWRSEGFAGVAGNAVVQPLREVSASIMGESRISSSIEELDRVLGGGLVAGSVVLIGGDPGIGKSTLLLQALASYSQQCNTLYVTGEESAQQVSLRAKRLGVDQCNINLLTETSVERVLDHVQKLNPDVVVIDSIQTLYTEMLESAPGSVSQVRESASRLVSFSKRTGTSLFLVGHVTKDGSLAGPRVLEHMVDAVLYFEGESGSRFRLVRAMKNRFGAVNELGVFGMTEKGLQQVNNPSAIFLSRHESQVAGSIILVTREGTRPFLVEVQALVDESHLSNPRRVAVGLEQNRLSMLLAVLHRHGGISMTDQDVFVNVVGGVRVTETGADLAVVLSVLSSFQNRAIASDLVVFGEIGLAGEIRPVHNGEDRLQTAAKQGFKRAIIPTANAPRKKQIEGMEIVKVNRLGDAMEQLI